MLDCCFWGYISGDTDSMDASPFGNEALGKALIRTAWDSL